MNNKHRFIGIIPARGGSKGISNKNLIPLEGKPLMDYTIEAAKGVQKLDRIILSTDDEAFAAHGKSQGIEVPWLRPPHLAEDDTPMLDVLIHLFEQLRLDGDQPTALVLLQPTSPLRQATHIEQAIEVFLKNDADNVVSVVEVPHQFTPGSLMALEQNTLKPYLDGPMITLRQAKPMLYARNGPAILIVKSTVLEQGKLYGKRIFPFIMSHEDSIDIDEPDDLGLVEYYLNQRS